MPAVVGGEGSRFRRLCRGQAEQLLANRKQVYQGAGSKQTVGILRQSSIAYLHKSELELQNVEDMFDLGAYARLASVFGSLYLVDAILLAI